MATKTTDSTNGKTKPGKSLVFLDKPLTKDELLSAGESLGRVLESTAFMVAFRSLIQGYQDQILASDDHEHHKREWLRAKAQAASEMCSEMAEYYSLAKTMTKEQEVSEEANYRAEEEMRGFH